MKFITSVKSSNHFHGLFSTSSGHLPFRRCTSSHRCVRESDFQSNCNKDLYEGKLTQGKLNFRCSKEFLEEKSYCNLIRLVSSTTLHYLLI